MHRIGLGYDIHRLKKGRPLWLGGVKIPFDQGLDGHSDADVLLHAITDALLGAASLPDIGHYFPPADPAIRNIASVTMLARAIREVQLLGYKVVNVDSVVVAEAPKIAPHREAMRKAIAQILGVSNACVQIKGKTNEGLDAVGRGEAIVAQAIVLLESDKL
jgi:2-C-methyl-D-erythritol 2,4-cyclodiphosphate synthase